jgi:hypothetical protein
VLGQPMVIARTRRNRLATPGLFQSTPVCNITNEVVATYNSEYLITPKRGLRD